MPGEHSELGGPDRSLEWTLAEVEGGTSMAVTGREHWKVEMETLASEATGLTPAASAWGWSLWKTLCVW